MIEKAMLALEDPAGLKSYFEFFDEQVPYWKISYGLYLLKNKKKEKETRIQSGPEKPLISKTEHCLPETHKTS